MSHFGHIFPNPLIDLKYLNLCLRDLMIIKKEMFRNRGLEKIVKPFKRDYISTFEVISANVFFTNQICFTKIPVTAKFNFSATHHLSQIAKTAHFTIKSRINIECHKSVIYMTV